jgi:hypothetical protein
MQGGYNGWHDDVSCNFLSQARQHLSLVMGNISVKETVNFLTRAVGVHDKHCAVKQD